MYTLDRVPTLPRSLFIKTQLYIIFTTFLGVVYTLDRVLLPNPPTILQLVKGKQEFSKFLQLLEFAGMSEEVGHLVSDSESRYLDLAL